MKVFKISMWIDAGFHHEKQCSFEVEDDATPEYIQNRANEITNEWVDTLLDVGCVYEPVLTAPGNGNPVEK